MSNLGQALTAIAGGVIGFFVGGGPTGALYGFELGLMAGTVISPTRLPGTFGPRLTDGKTTTATIGGPVSFGFGFFSVSGTVIYLGTCNEHSHTASNSNKGAPTQSQTTYTYTQSIAIGLCEGVVDNVYRIWENGELVYDKRPQQDSETDGAYNARVTANITYESTFVFYKGTALQTADPTMEADLGVGNVPGYRDLSYIMFPDRLLRDDQGQRHPTFKFEMHVGAASYDGHNFDPANLQDIITAICARCGYDTITQIDASDLADVTVGGYAIQAIMAGRDALNPLRSVGFFDCVESGIKLKFVKRGHSPLRTLDATDLGVYDDPSNANPDAAISVVEAQEVDLPRSIRVSYISTDQDYQDGQQLSPSRYDTDAVNDVDVQLAVCISDSQALQTAEILWNDAWQSRYTYQTSVDQSNADIEPSDVLIVPVLGTEFQMRVESVSDASQVLRKLSLVSDDSGGYVSTAVASAPSRAPTQMSALSGTVVEFIDIPALQDADDNAGMYAFAYGDGTGNRWSSGLLYKSVDGDTFAQKAALSGSPPFGVLLNDTAVGTINVWDDLNFIDVVMKKGTFDSRTDDAVIAGANTVAVGAPGRWELLQFANTTPMSDTAVAWIRFSHLLRGRRGTEWAVGTGLAGDRVVGVTMGNFYRIVLQNSEIGAALTYKAITNGAPYASGVDQVFTDTAVSLKPFAPYFARGKYVSSDFVFTWLRRDRLGTTLTPNTDTVLSDVPEAYSIDIYNGASVIRTLTSSTPTVTYLDANITSDFGSHPSSFHVKIYQLSPIVGRGYPFDTTVVKEA